jgi:hypothetical protein
VNELDRVTWRRVTAAKIMQYSRLKAPYKGQGGQGDVVV